MLNLEVLEITDDALKSFERYEQRLSRKRMWPNSRRDKRCWFYVQDSGVKTLKSFL